MDVCLSKKYTGLSRDLVVNISDGSISTSSGSEFWNFKRVRHLMDYWGVKYRQIDAEYKSLIKALKIESESINM